MTAMLRSGWVRLRALLGSDTTDALQSLAALIISASAALVAGLALASLDDTLEEFPGIILLIPAAIALRGNVFGAMGSRLGTAVHTGAFRLSLRGESVVGRNIGASAFLSLVLSVVLAVMAKGFAVVFGVSPSMSLADFIVISTLGGMLASVGVGIITVLLAAGSGRYHWDLDNVTAPLVTATGDVLTVPALLLATGAAGVDVVTPTLAWVSAGAAVLAVALVARSAPRDMGRIVRESVPILVFAGLLDLIAGLTVEQRLDSFVRFEALFILLPGYLGTAGALGGILSSRMSSKFHLGLDTASFGPSRAAWLDIRSIFVVAVPTFVFGGVISHAAAQLVDTTTPGVADMIAISLVGGLLATIFVVAVAYYTTMASFRFGLDPDTYGIPAVTGSLDLVGAFTLILAIVAFGAT